LFAEYSYDENDNMLEELWQYEYANEIYPYRRDTFTIESYDVGNQDDTIPEYSEFSVFPNPIKMSQREMLQIKFSLEANTEVKLSIYNILGQRIVSENLGRYESGIHSISWNPKNVKKMGSGMYFVRINNAKSHSTQKLMILK
jgi:hypothetical protein